jgi:phosphatidylglycerophosphate synthase
MSYYQWRFFALLLVLAIALTDHLDGKLARRFKLVSPLGARLDETNDKLAMLILFGFFSWQGQLPLLVLILFATRELGITLYRSWVRHHHPRIDVSAKMPGKIKTCLQFALAGILCLPAVTWVRASSLFTAIVMLGFSYGSAVYIVSQTQLAIGRNQHPQI